MSRSLVAGLFLVVLACVPAVAPFAAPRSERAQLAHDLVLRWGMHVQRHYGADVHEWAHAMVPVFARVPLPRMRSAMQATTFEGMNRALTSHAPGADADANLTRAIDGGLATSPRVVARALGEAATDLVFVPVTPCRLLDTRVAGGPIAANSSRGFDVSGAASFTGQGGDASACGLGSVNFAAAAINFTVVTPGAGGYLTAYPFGATQPLAATVNYTAGDIRGNLAVVKLDQGAAAEELSVYSFAQTHLVADIVGYFAAPAATALDCVERVSSAVSINPGGTGTVSTPSCPAGYTVSSGGCASSNFSGRVVSTRTFPTSENHFCAFVNQATSGTVTGTAYANCCRVPGR